jgi:hypothetical protein
VRRVVATAALSILLAAPDARAAGRTLEAEPLAGAKVRIDGVIKEWPGRMTDLTETIQGRAGSDLRVAGQIGYDDTSLYVAFDVRDDKLVRTSAFGPGEDHGTLLIAFPDTQGRYTLHQLDLYPGDPGKTAAAVRRKGANVAGAKIVEAPKKGGYTIEAQIPWSAFPQASRVRVGLRAALRFTDADSPGTVKAVVATSTAGNAAGLPPLPFESEQGLDASLIRAKNLSRKPHKQAFGNVAGDAMLEHVAIYGRYLTIVGPKYRGGKQFYFGELGVSDPAMVTRLRLQDLDGDGRSEILIDKKVGAADKYRGVLEVLKVADDDTPFVAFAHETAIVTKDGRIENEVKLVKRGKLHTIEVSQGKARGFEPDTYAEPLSGDMPGALLPWESVGSRSYQWDGKKFDKVGETAHKPKPTAKPHAKKQKREGPPPPPAPRPPTADELQDRLYALYRKERKLGAKPPRFDFVTDVAGDSRMERVLVHGNDVVVFGPGYRGGTSYAFISVGFADPKDILHVTARDLTGDGKAEIIVRGLLHAKASKELGGDVVARHALFIYGVTENGVQRVFAAETGRALGENSILGAVAFVPAERGLAIELRPARAVGWDEKSYPFPTDTTAAGGLEPLLLPWGASPKRYVWNGNAYVPR